MLVSIVLQPYSSTIVLDTIVTILGFFYLNQVHGTAYLTPGPADASYIGAARRDALSNVQCWPSADKQSPDAVAAMTEDEDELRRPPHRAALTGASLAA